MKNCISCKSEKRPDEVRQEKHKEIITKSIQFDPDEGYSVTYAKNGLIPALPDNSDNVKRMMKGLEGKLIKNGLLDQFNTSLKEFIVNTQLKL